MDTGVRQPRKLRNPPPYIVAARIELFALKDGVEYPKKMAPGRSSQPALTHCQPARRHCGLRSASTNVSQNQASPCRQSTSRSFDQERGADPSARDCASIQSPRARACRRRRWECRSSPNDAVGLEAGRVLPPREVAEPVAQAPVGHLGKVEEQVMVELAPAELAQERLDLSGPRPRHAPPRHAPPARPAGERPLRSEGGARVARWPRRRGGPSPRPARRGPQRGSPPAGRARRPHRAASYRNPWARRSRAVEAPRRRYHPRRRVRPDGASLWQVPARSPPPGCGRSASRV